MLMKSAKYLFYPNRLNYINKARGTWNIEREVTGKMTLNRKIIDIEPEVLNDFYYSIARKLNSVSKLKRRPLKLPRRPTGG